MPKRYGVRITPQARDDILEIAAYITDQSEDPNIAELWETSLYEQMQMLELFPNSYPPFAIRPCRKMLHGRYIVLFRVEEEAREVVVCRVFHGARLVENIGPIEA